MENINFEEHKKEIINKIDFLEKQIYIKSKKNKLVAEKKIIKSIRNMKIDLNDEKLFKLIIGSIFFITTFQPNSKNEKLVLRMYDEWNKKLKNNK